MTTGVRFPVLVGVVANHTGVTVLHSLAHLNLSIVPPPVDLAFITIVIFVSPIAAVFIRWRGSRRRSGFRLAASMLASLAYGVVFHALLPGPDNLGSIPSSPWGLTFIVSGLAIAVLEAAGVVVGAKDARR